MSNWRSWFAILGRRIIYVFLANALLHHCLLDISQAEAGNESEKGLFWPYASVYLYVIMA